MMLGRAVDHVFVQHRISVARLPGRDSTSTITPGLSQLPQNAQTIHLTQDPCVLQLIWVISRSQDRCETTNQGSLLTVSNSGLKAHTG